MTEGSLPRPRLPAGRGARRLVPLLLLLLSAPALGVSLGVLSTGDGEAWEPLLPMGQGLRIHPLSGSASWTALVHLCDAPGPSQALRITWHSEDSHLGLLGEGWTLSVEESVTGGIPGIVHRRGPDGSNRPAVLDSGASSKGKRDKRKIAQQVAQAMEEAGLEIDSATRRALAHDPKALEQGAQWTVASAGSAVEGTYRTLADGAVVEASDEGFLLRWPDGTVHRFDVEGHLLERRALVGAPVTLRWTEEGRPQRQSRSGCPEILFGYDTEGRLSTIGGSEGLLRVDWGEDGRIEGWALGARRIAFEWDDAGLLSKLRSGGESIELQWLSHVLSGVKSAGVSWERRDLQSSPESLAARMEGDGHTWDWELDVDRRVRSLRVDGQLLERVLYDARDRPIEVQDGLGRQVDLAWDEDGSLLRVAQGELVVELDGGAQPRSLRVAGGSWTLGWRGPGRLVSVEAGDSTLRLGRGSDGELRSVEAGSKRYEFVSDMAGRPSLLRPPDGAPWELAWSKQGLLERAGRAGEALSFKRNGDGGVEGVTVGEQRVTLQRKHGRVSAIRWGQEAWRRLSIQRSGDLRLDLGGRGDVRVELGDGGVEKVRWAGQSSRVSRDSRGRVVSLEGPLGSATARWGMALEGWSLGGWAASLKWSEGFPTQLVDPVVGGHSMGVGQGQPRSLSGPNGGRAGFEWSRAGWLKQIDDAWSEVWTLERDGGGVATALRGPLHTWQQEDGGARLTRDGDTVWTLERGAGGVLRSLTGTRGGVHLELDSAGGVTSVVDGIGRRFPVASPPSLSTELDAGGRPRLLLRGDTIFRLVRDSWGHPSSLQGANGQPLWVATHGALGLATFTRYGEGAASFGLVRDAWGRVSALTGEQRLEWQWGTDGRISRWWVGPDMGWLVGRDLTGQMATLGLPSGRLLVERNRERRVQALTLPGQSKELLAEIPGSRDPKSELELGFRLEPGMGVEDLPDVWPDQDEARSPNEARVRQDWKGLPLAWQDGSLALPDPRGSGSLGWVDSDGSVWLDPLAVEGELDSALAPTLPIPTTLSAVGGLASPAPDWALLPPPSLSLDGLGPGLDRRDLLWPWAPGLERVDVLAGLVLLGRLDPWDLAPLRLASTEVPGPRMELPADLLRGLMVLQSRGKVSSVPGLGAWTVGTESLSLAPALDGVVWADPLASLGSLRPWQDPAGPLPLRRPFASWDDAPAPCLSPSDPAELGISSSPARAVRTALLCAVQALSPRPQLLANPSPVAVPGSAPAALAIPARLGPVQEARLGLDGRLWSLDLGASARAILRRRLLRELLSPLPGSSVAAPPQAYPYLPSLAGPPAAGWGLLPDDALAPVYRDGSLEPMP